MDILWYNWKDIKNPGAGGAEVYTHQIAKRLVERGHKITLFVSWFEGSNQEESIDGIRVIRRGGRFGVYRKAKAFYKHAGTNFDCVVDEINTRPFLTPAFVKNTSIVALIHQLAREFWFYETPFPVALIGYYFLEKRWLANYRNVPTITVSESSKIDLQKLGFTNISIVHNGLNVEPVQDIPAKNERPTIIYVGRMKKAKRPQDVIEAFKIIKNEVPDAELWMVGDGYMRRNLESKNKGVKFYGYLDNNLRDELVQKAWVLAVPSIREGWSQVVTDSNALGTPAVGYDVPGLRDSIRAGYDGLLVEGNPPSLAAGLTKILKNKDSRETFAKNSVEWATHFSWDESAKRFAQVLERVETDSK